jgi:tRNA dimethylallyltransferase
VLAEEPALELNESSEKFPVLEEPTNVLLAKLKEVDPTMADRWHPNERRKIQRSLEIYLRTGKPASQLYNEQRLKRSSSPQPTNSETTAGRLGLRFQTLVFWVHADKDVLHKRLDGRVDKMLAKGLLSEVQELSGFCQNSKFRTGNDIDQSRGIWVSIGYKEFKDYQGALLDVSQTDIELQKLKVAAIEKTQAATRQYANRQIKWIRIKLLNALIGAGQKNNIFLVDGTNLSQWQENVFEPATSVTERFLAAQTLPFPSTLCATAAKMLTPKREYDLGQRPDLWQKKVCETCGTIAVTENDWTLHVKSRAHRRVVGVRKKQENTKEVQKEDRKVAQADVIDVLESYLESFPREASSSEAE